MKNSCLSKMQPSTFFLVVTTCCLVLAQADDKVKGPKVTDKVSFFLQSTIFIRKALNSTSICLKVWFDIEIGGEAIGRIEIGLFGKYCTIAQENKTTLF